MTTGNIDTISESDVARVLCCPKGCMRTDDCWAHTMEINRKGTPAAVLELFARNSPDSGWQPIATAPLHYTPILLRQDDTVGEGCHATHIGWEFFNSSHVLRRNPTHWRPLPTLPSGQPQASGG